MATNQNKVANYTNIADIKDYWLKTIAPNYFDFDDVNTYNSGLFGYINEIMGNTTEDAFNATNIARREFYPITAQYMSSLYKMAALQSIDIPLTVPSHCKCALIIPQSEIEEFSRDLGNGSYECTIDNCLQISADNLNFMLDYPIKIISKRINGKLVHTTHYDINYSNSLSTNNRNRYLSNQIINANGVSYIAIFIDAIRQVEMEQVSQVIIRDSVLSTSVMDIDFEGDLANFEVFYIENGNDDEIQLRKVMINGAVPSIPFVFYELVNTNKIRLTFKYNNVFIPKYNSEIICRIYTSKGAEGNFKKFDGDLICSSSSEKYSYNSNMTIVGKVNGPATGGVNISSVEELRSQIIRAYSTNSTITTSSDLQLKFDEISNSLSGVQVLFKKKRDDVFSRLFGAYSLLKDDSGNILPTNTLNVGCNRSDLVDINSPGDVSRVSIKPGTIYKYVSDSSYETTVVRKGDGSVMTILDIDESSTDHMFTNPFLIGININPNVVGYYMNTISENYPVDYSFVNDSSPIQFISNGITVDRNAILGHNFYKIGIKVTPSINDMDYTPIVELADTESADYMIRAKHSGKVTSLKYYTDPNTNENYIRATVEYNTDIEEEKYEYIQASYVLNAGNIVKPGYDFKFNVGDRFIENDILATKMPIDKRALRVVADLDTLLRVNNYYIPFVMEAYNPETNIYQFNAYLSTEDEIDSSSRIIITHGIYDYHNDENTFMPVRMKDLSIEISVLYNNDGQNMAHKYDYFAGLNLYTLTNSYITNADNLIYFIEDLQFIRSIIDYLPGSAPNDWKFTISEVPLVQATWAIDHSRYSSFIEHYKDLDAIMQNVYYNLENNFSIDTKFYNTYGKARFYQVGNMSNNLVKLDNVKISMKFGIKLNVQANQENFIPIFREFVKDYIENSDSIGYASQDIFIFNLISDAKQKLSDISYIEYYGFNNYDHMAQKIVGPAMDDYIEDFIPEFVNLNTAYTVDGIAYPDVSITILP